MSHAPLSDYEPSPPGPLPTLGLPELVGSEQGAALFLVGLLLLVLLFLLVRCFRILLDPYSSMPSSSWGDYKDRLERGQFDHAVV